jgi:predicted acetyltransferase
MASPYPVRPITEDELAAFRGVSEHAFHWPPPSEQARAQVASRVELDRTLAAFDGAEQVGVAGVYSFRMAVPGALLPVAGVTMVAVLPTHRRRGILSALMRRQLADIHERGEPVAALYASEAGIYGRFGYGRASAHQLYRLRRGEGALAAHAPADPALRLRIAEPAAARAELAKVYELALPERPGLFARTGAWWDRVLDDPAEERAGATPLRCVLAEDSAGPRGYALYTARERWDEPAFLPDSSLRVREAITTDPAATAAIWGDLLSRDLTTEFVAAMRPVDDPVLHLLADPRRVRAQVSDGLWARLVDVPAALSQRRYACPVDIVIEVTDELCPHNSGRWRLATGEAPPGAAGRPWPGFGATCERASGPADLVAPVQALGSAYLGGTRLGPWAAAGLVQEAAPGAVAALSAAMSWDPAPWCPVIF